MADSGLRALIDVALAEDLGAAGDVTSMATVAADAVACGAFVTRQSGVVAGLDAVVAVFDAVDPWVEVAVVCADGDHVVAGQPLVRVVGNARSILAVERTALNLLCHLSGVATQTARYVDEVAGMNCVVRDTRKTTPGLRALEKRAVAAGGGVNHRHGLYDALLVKDNHGVAAGGLAAATRRALDAAGGLVVQVEVDTLAQLHEVLAAGARVILLDNFTLADLRAAVVVARGAAVGDGAIFLEASGGVSLDTVAAIAATGVDAVAVGALTHSVTALDVGLDLDLERDQQFGMKSAEGKLRAARG